MINNNTRLDLDDTTSSSIIKLAEGNPGALNVMMQVMKETPAIDPDNAFEGFGTLLNLDM